MSGYEPFPADARADRPEPAVDPRLASRWRRFWALLVDTLAVMLGGFVASVAAAAATDDEDVIGAVFLLVWLALVLLYYPLLMRRRGRRNGQTLGKQLLGVRVVTREGTPVTFGRSFRRDVLGTTVLSFLSSGLYTLADYPVGLFTDRRQTLHDRIGATFVFRADVAVRAAAEEPPAIVHDAAPFESDQWLPPAGYEEANRAFGR